MHSLSLHCCFRQQTVILILWSLFLTSIVQTKINACREVRSHVTELHLCNYTCAQLFSHRNAEPFPHELLAAGARGKDSNELFAWLKTKTVRKWGIVSPPILPHVRRGWRSGSACSRADGRSWGLFPFTVTLTQISEGVSV